MATQGRVRFYREFLTPALHRRFTRAASVTLLTCYVESVLIGDKSSLLWSWFPLGPVGIRALLLFISCLVIFILRVSQLHFGSRTAISGFDDFQNNILSWNSIKTFGFYLASAWWFSEVYFWSMSTSANLEWATNGKYQRRQLNERPMFLRSVFVMLAMAQSTLHVVYDYSRVSLPNITQKEETIEKGSHVAIPPLTQLKDSFPRMLKFKINQSIFVTIAGMFFYFVLFRRTTWSFFLSVARMFSNIPRNSEPPWFPPYNIGLLARSIWVSFLLLWLWEMVNVVFGLYVAQEPLKKGKPLTDESRDPNGSLLNGLKSKKEAIKTFSFWELVYISRKCEYRRKSIFTDLDHPDGSAWSRVLAVSLEVIQATSDRIVAFYNPVDPTKVREEKIQVERLPLIATPLINDESVIGDPEDKKQLEWAKSVGGSVAKYFGESPPAQSPLITNPLTPRAKKYLGAARDKLLTEQQKIALTPSGINSSFHEHLLQFLRARGGKFFRQTFRGRLCKIVLGAPYAELGVIVDAIDAVTNLAVASLNEDKYGMVQKDIPNIIRALVRTTTSIEDFMKKLPIHWTDVEFDETDENGRKCEDIETVIAHLRRSLRMLIEAFGEFAVDLGLGPVEMMAARRVAQLEATP